MLKVIASLTVALIAAGIWHISPIVKPLPKPIGPYSIGIKTIHTYT